MDRNFIIFRENSQSWTFTETRTYNTPNGDRIFRVHIKRDAYDSQSFAQVEQWRVDGGWATFHSIGYSYPQKQAPAYLRVTYVDHDPSAHPFLETADVLWDVVNRCFGIASIVSNGDMDDVASRASAMIAELRA